MYTTYNFTGASFKVGGGDWIPLSLPNTIESNTVILDADWNTIAYEIPKDFSVTLHADTFHRVPLLQIFTYKPTIARRKIWRYMDRCGL